MPLVTKYLPVKAPVYQYHLHTAYEQYPYNGSIRHLLYQWSRNGTIRDVWKVRSLISGVHK